MESPSKRLADSPAVHKRSRSAVLKSVITGRPASPQKLQSEQRQPLSNTPIVGTQGKVSELRQLYTNLPVLGEIQQNGRGSPSRNASKPLPEPQRQGNAPLQKSPQRKNFDFESNQMFHQPPTRPKDKENTTPPSSTSQTPIWAQFTSQNCFLDDKASQDPFVDKFTHTANDFQGKLQTPSRNAFQPQAAESSPSKTPRLASSPAKGHARSKSEAVPDKNLDQDFESVLVARNIPEHMRFNMRSLDAKVKAEFIRNAQQDLAKSPPKSTAKSPAKTPTKSPSKPSLFGIPRPKTPTLERGRSNSRAADKEETKVADEKSPKRSRSRSRTFTFSKGEKSPNKRQRSNSRPRSLMSLKNLSSSSLASLGFDGARDSKEHASPAAGTVSTRPEDFVQYLRENPKPSSVEVGKIHKLRILLRNETVTWVQDFVRLRGMDELLALLKRVMDIEWRDDHDDLLLHEVLLCLKGLSTTEVAIEKLVQVEDNLFPDLTGMIFNEVKKGPSEFNTRSVVFNLLFAYLSAASGSTARTSRAKKVLSFLSDPEAPEDERPVVFILQMHQKRPYIQWCREVTNVCKDVFWIFLHHLNVVAAVDPPASLNEPNHSSFSNRHYPRERPPVPAAPYVGGVEWEATNYLAMHLDLLNAIVASLPTKVARNELRAELRASGFERTMGGYLRLCKEKFYSAVHDGLRTWVSAAAEDHWDVSTVRQGPVREGSSSPSKSPSKGAESPPKLDLPKLNLDGGGNENERPSEKWI